MYKRQADTRGGAIDLSLQAAKLKSGPGCKDEEISLRTSYECSVSFKENRRKIDQSNLESEAACNKKCIAIKGHSTSASRDTIMLIVNY